MASFEEIRAKMNSKYGDSEEEKKKQQEQKQKRKEVSPSATANFDAVRSKMDSKFNSTFNHVDESFINTFLSDAQSYLNSSQDKYTGMGYSNRDSVYGEQKKKMDDLRSRSWDIRQYLSKNKASMKEEDYASLISLLDYFDKTSISTDYSFYKKKDGYSQWDTEAAYNEYVRQQGLNSMTSEELKAAQAGSVKSEDDKNIIQELMLSNMPYRRDYAEQDGRDMGLYDEIEKKRKYISDKYGIQFTESSYENSQLLTSLMNGEVIAYTTSDGQNVTWDSLHNNALLAEDLASRYETYSKNADWAEKSQAISTVADTESDYQIVNELARTMVPYDWETAAANGVDRATFDAVEKKRKYISDKYGVDLPLAWGCCLLRASAGIAKWSTSLEALEACVAAGLSHSEGNQFALKARLVFKNNRIHRHDAFAVLLVVAGGDYLCDIGTVAETTCKSHLEHLIIRSLLIIVV